MPNTDLTGLFGATLLLFALIVRMPWLRAFSVPRRAALLAASVIVISIPLWGLSLAGFARGITGDLSIASLLLLMLALVRSLSGCVLVEQVNRRLMLRAVAITAVVFYPFALGLSTLDPYRLGYGNLWFMVLLLGLAVWSSLRYSTFLALCIALAVAAWSTGWYESPNLWDYLLDPWLAVYALAVQGKYGWMLWRKKNA